MKFPPSLALFSVLAFAEAAHQVAQAQEEWKPIKDAAELRRVVSGNSFDGEFFWDYYRSDGAMAYYNKQYDSVVIRKWVIRDDAKLCTYIYVKPDKLVECTTFERSSQNPDVYRVQIDRGYSVQMKLSKEPPWAMLVDAINDKAGPAN